MTDLSLHTKSSIPAFAREKVEWERKPGNIDANMKEYEEAYKTFQWEDVEKEFDWYHTGKINIVHEAIDRHAKSWRKNKIALYFSSPDRDEKYTFQDLMTLTSRFGNLLKKLKVQKGDRVAIFLPRSPELYIALLGTNRIGAIPLPLFEAFMDQAIEDRLTDSEAICIITTPELKSRIPFDHLPYLKHQIMVRHLSKGRKAKLEKGEIDFLKGMSKVKDWCEPIWLTKDDGLIIHYTSGSTGKSKGALHHQYAMVGHFQTTKWVLDLRDDDVYWCSADPGWVTGTSYGIYGPWTLGASSVVLGGRFDPAQWYATIEKYKVTVWYSAPTAYRMLMASGDTLPSHYDLSSLRHICTVGEPLNPEALKWIKKITGLAPHETWWMTETGMQIVCNYRCADFKIGATGKSFPGTYATVVDDNGMELEPYEMGHLVVKPGWPSMMKEIWKNKERFQEYFRIPGWYLSGDTAYKDEDGFIWYAGRSDDVIKTSGERVGPFEVESALVQHQAVAEAGVIGKPDELRGHIVKAYVTLRNGHIPSDELKEDLSNHVRCHLAAHAAPREIEFVERIPKTRSGKIMRRVLLAWDQGIDPGDISTMEE